jgi:hypothetical protein
MSKAILTTCFLLIWLFAPANRGNLVSGERISFLFSKSTMIDDSIRKLESNEQNLPAKDLLLMSLNGFAKMIDEGTLQRTNLITVIDFSLPSTQKRLWVLDLENGETLFHTLVAHGKNTGELYAENFSNVSGSYTSSLGFYTTGDTYQGGHGLSLYLDGLESGINDNARERAIVMHGAEYATEDFIKENGRLGRSFGCPSIPPEVHEAIIQTIAGGTCLFIFANNDSYINESSFVSKL